MIIYTIICSIIFIVLLVKNGYGLKNTFIMIWYKSRMLYWQRKHGTVDKNGKKRTNGLQDVYERYFPSNYKIGK